MLDILESVICGVVLSWGGKTKNHLPHHWLVYNMHLSRALLASGYDSIQ